MCLIWSKSTVCIKKAGNVLDLVKINRLHYKKRLEMCLIWSKSTVCITKRLEMCLIWSKSTVYITKKAGNVLDLVKNQPFALQKGWKCA